MSVNLTAANGKFQANKIKSEKCSLQLLDGDIEIATYLEAMNITVKQNDGKIKIKRLSVSGIAQITQRRGSIKIGSLYTNVFANKKESTAQLNQEESSESKTFPIQIAKESETIKRRLDKHENVVRIHAMESQDIEIDFSHGYLSVESENVLNLTIRRMKNEQLYVRAREGTISLYLVELKRDSYIKLERGGKLTIRIEQEIFNANIYDISRKTYIF